jgi:hypothetical protein
LYADDLQIIFECKPSDINTALQLVNYDIAAIKEWAVANCMMLNPSKTQCIIIGSPFSLKQINYGDLCNIQVSHTDVPFVNCVKNLGIFIDSSLTWNNQISHTIRKCFNSLYLLNQLRKFIPDDTKKISSSTVSFSSFILL